MDNMGESATSKLIDGMLIISSIAVTISLISIAKNYISSLLAVPEIPPFIKTKLAINKKILTVHEKELAVCIVDPSSINVSWDDIGGMDEIIKEIKDEIIAPITHRFLFSTLPSYISPPRGLLLYGMPGCGKTMLAKIIAKESNCTFINVDVSDLSSKWYGESSKLLAALFSLADKVQPSIIFIDEIESLLKVRSENDHEATSFIKTSFMSLWDGLGTDKSNHVLVIGATNRPEILDPAIARRFVKKIEIKLPNQFQRESILKSILAEDNTIGNKVDLSEIASKTRGFSGSDLKELCRNVAMNRFIDHVKEKNRIIDACTKAVKAEEAKYPVDQESFEFISIGKPKIHEYERQCNNDLQNLQINATPLTTDTFLACIYKLAKYNNIDLDYIPVEILD